MPNISGIKPYTDTGLNREPPLPVGDPLKAATYLTACAVILIPESKTNELLFITVLASAANFVIGGAEKKPTLEDHLGLALICLIVYSASKSILSFLHDNTVRQNNPDR